MECSSCRDVVSAQLDGEATPEEVAEAEHHLATCAPCRSYRAEVTRLHRAVRVAAAEPVPDLSVAILAAHPPIGTRVDAEVGVWRLGLVLVALAQIVAAVAHLGGDHIARDQASWEAALAAGFAWAAWRPARATGLLPVTAVLTVLLLVNGGLTLAGAGTHHLLAPLGLGLLVLATRRSDGRRPLVVA
ncbi:MAG: putative integral rane protein [Actinomycetia bacterium]|nr:putative integral rane protein [Actinomycetes bacterium]